MATFKDLRELSGEIDMAVALFGADGDFHKQYRNRLRTIVAACADVELPPEAERHFVELRDWYEGLLKE